MASPQLRHGADGDVVFHATVGAVEEIAPGIWHWSAPHPRIKIRVHSYYVPAERTLIDPIAPAEGLDWFAEHVPPEPDPAHESPPLPLEQGVRGALRRLRPLRP